MSGQVQGQKEERTQGTGCTFAVALAACATVDGFLVGPWMVIQLLL